MKTISETIAGIIMFMLVVISFGAWLTHVIFCIGTGAWGFLVAGALFFPIGIIHGIILWF